MIYSSNTIELFSYILLIISQTVIYKLNYKRRSQVLKQNSCLFVIQFLLFAVFFIIYLISM